MGLSRAMSLQDLLDVVPSDSEERSLLRCIDFDRLRAELDACLLSDPEWRLGVEHWLRMPDPFAPWHQDVA